MELIIRDAREDDIQSIIEMRKELDDFHSKILPELFISACLYKEEDIKTYFNAEKTKVIVVEDSTSNNTVAYAVLNKERVEERLIFKKKTMLYVNDICVREPYRGKGIGRFVFEYIIKYAKESKVDTLELNVFSANQRAIELYESFGLKDQNKRMTLRL